MTTPPRGLTLDRWLAWFETIHPKRIDLRLDRFVAVLDALVWDRSEVFSLRLWGAPHDVAFYSLAFGLATKSMVLPEVAVGALLPTLGGGGALDVELELLEPLGEVRPDQLVHRREQAHHAGHHRAGALHAPRHVGAVVTGVERDDAAPVEVAGIWAATITEIRNRKNQILFKRRAQQPARLLRDDVVRDAHNVLNAVTTRGTARRAGLPQPAYGKTGTSQDYRDAWFIGYTSALVAGVWFGNDDRKPMKDVTGGELPARVWGNFMGRGLVDPIDDVRATNPASNEDLFRALTKDFVEKYGEAGALFRAMGFDAAILHFGANDAGRGVTAETFRADTETLIARIRDWTKDADFPVILMSDPYRKGLDPMMESEYARYPGALRAIAAADPHVLAVNSRRLMDERGWKADRPDRLAELLMDDVHYTPRGAIELAQAEMGELLGP